jgi:hypothetical protein
MSLAALLERLDDDADVQELEDILETYFAQLDRTCARLRALEEHVAQTEDYVNIDLDSKRNVLIEIMLVTAFFMLTVLCYTTQTGLFGALRAMRICAMRIWAFVHLLTWRLRRCSDDAAQRGGQGHTGDQGGAPAWQRSMRVAALHARTDNLPLCCLRALSQPFYAVNVVSTLAVVSTCVMFVALLRRRRILHI